MPPLTLDERVETLESLMAEVLRAQAATQAELRALSEAQQRTQAHLDQLSHDMQIFKAEMRLFKDEMRSFKDEMLAFKDEMRAFKDEMRAFKDEMRAFKDEMRAFKDEMRAFKDEMRAVVKDMNKRWGDLANKMGTLAEDIVAPGIPAILRQVVGCEKVDSSAVRVRRVLPSGEEREFDVVVTCGEYALINETKSKLTVDHVREFVGLLRRIREFFPEFHDKKIVGAVASLHVEGDVVTFAERQGLVVIGLGEDNLAVLNSPKFVPKTF